MIAPSIARPLVPRMFDRTLATFRLASSRIFWIRSVCWDLADELFARARQIPPRLDGRRRHEAAADQPVRQQVGDPRRIVDIRLAPRHVADVLGIGEHELDLPLQQMPDRFPVPPGGLQGDVLQTVWGGTASSKSSSRAPEASASSTQFGVLAGFRVQLLNGFEAPGRNRPRSPHSCRLMQPD